MYEKTLAEKLYLRPHDCAVIVNAPNHYQKLLLPLPEGVQITARPDGTYDFVHLFVRNRQELEQYGQIAIQAVREGGRLWISYPKISSGIKTDITRDKGWEILLSADWEGVAQVSIDETWSALRFRPRAEIGR